MATHEIKKLRREPVRRKLHVFSKQFITPRMLRIVFQSSELAGFDSPSPDDHVKIFLPPNETGEIVMRDFTPRAWDLEAGSFTLEFALHDHGPAAEWARQCRPGDMLEIGGPRGSAVVPDDFDWYVLIGDAAALPSFARRLESLRAGVPVHLIVLVAAQEEQQIFTSSSQCHSQWLISSASLEEDALALVSALESLKPPPGEGYIWIATEDAIARSLYESAVNTLKHPKEWIKASGYWHASPPSAGD